MTPGKLIALMVGRELSLVDSHPACHPPSIPAGRGILTEPGVRTSSLPARHPEYNSPCPAERFTVPKRGREVLEVSHASDPAIAVQGFTRRGAFSDINIEVRSGEILGLAGLMGAGRTELVSAIYGLFPADGGAVFMRGQPVKIRSPRDAIAHGIAMVTEDRRGQGLVLSMPVKHNLTLANLARFCFGPFVMTDKENQGVDEQIRVYRIKARDRNQRTEHLSGGNQQKIVLANSLLGDPRVLILDEPTRGIDIGAKSELYQWIRRLAQSGLAVILVSSELPEIMALSDRIMVLRQGRVAAELDPSHTTQEEILRFAMPV